MCLHRIYDAAASFPQEEKYITSTQLKSSALSIILNIVEGYRRNSNNYFHNFLNNAYGSLFETKYLINFARKRNFIDQNNWNILNSDLDELGKMIWPLKSKLKGSQ